MKQWTHPCQILTFTWLRRSHSAFHWAIAKQRRGGCRATEGGCCSKAEGGVLVTPSVLLTTSRLDEVLRPTHLWQCWSKNSSRQTSCKPSGHLARCVCQSDPAYTPGGSFPAERRTQTQSSGSVLQLWAPLSTGHGIRVNLQSSGVLHFQLCSVSPAGGSPEETPDRRTQSVWDALTWIWAHWRVWSRPLGHKSGPGRPGLTSINQNLRNERRV